MNIEHMISHLEQNGYTVVPNDRIKIISASAKVGASEPEEREVSRTQRVSRELSRDTIQYMTINRTKNDNNTEVAATITLVLGE